MQINSTPSYPDIPFEDLRQTKDILRLQIHSLALALKEGNSLSVIQHHFQDIFTQANKCNDPILTSSLKKLHDLITHNWPLTEQTPLKALETLKALFSLIDEKTLF